MNISQIEAIANDACFSVNQEVSNFICEIKQEAERKFMQFCSQQNLQNIHFAMCNCSQTVLFVLMEFLYKTNLDEDRAIHLFKLISVNAQQWYQQSGLIIRQDNQTLEKYVENSLNRTLGFLIKILYIKTETQKQIVQIIKSHQNPRYRLFLWKGFIEAVSPLDSSMTFLSYRTMIYNFQDNIIPIITEQLVPFFHKVQDTIKVNELSTSLQSNVSVSQKKEEIKGLIFTKYQMKFSELVFFILREIITFNYNITFSQYDSGEVFESCLICFPEPVTRKMTSRQFLESIFYITQKLMNQMPDTQFFQDIFQCLKKLMMSKLTYTASEIKKIFTSTVLEGMNRLFRISNPTERGILHLLEANSKFISNIEMPEIREFDDKFIPWIGKIEELIIIVIEKTQLSFNNIILNQAIELAIKIVGDAISPQLKGDFGKFKQFGTRINNAFLKSFLGRDINILGQTKLRDIEELKKLSSSFFKPIKNLMAINLDITFNILQQGFEAALRSENINQIVNSFLLFTELCEGRIFDKNFLYESPNFEDIVRFGKIMNTMCQWIDSYRSIDKSIQFIDVAILIFIERILNECLSELTWDNSSIVLKSKLYKSVKETRKNMSEQAFLIYCFNQIVRNLHKENKMVIQYSLDSLKSLLAKLKWGLKRENFKETIIAKEMSNVCYEISHKSLGNNLLKWRKKLFNIITTLNFDDVLDSYRVNIDQLIQQMLNSLNSNQWKVLYDLTGVCESIDTITIYKYFLTRLQKFIGIPALMKGFYENCQGDPKILKAILKLNHAMLTNKCQRLSGTKNSHRVYHLIQCLMPYWTQLLEKLTSEQTSSINLQLLRIFVCIARQGHVNFYLVQRVVSCYNKYLYNFIANLNAISSWIPHYPKLMKSFKECIKIFCISLPEVIFCNTNRQITHQLHTLILYFMKQSITKMQNYLNGNKSLEEDVLNSFDYLKNFYSYIRTAFRFTHKPDQLENIKIVFFNSIEEKCQYVYYLFMFGMTKGSISSQCLRYIACLIQNLYPIIGERIGLITNKLGLKEEKVNSLIQILNETEEEDADEDTFINHMKTWFQTSERDSSIPQNIEY